MCLRKWCVFAFLFVAVSLPAAAQVQQKGELFGGYQFGHLDGGFNASGWNASIAYHANDWFGIKGDFGGLYKSGVKFHTYMGGPVFTFGRSERVTPFVHTLVGAAVASNGSSSTAFAAALGGGFDVKVSEHVAVRLVQADWLILHGSGSTDMKNVRVSSGIVFRF